MRYLFALASLSLSGCLVDLLTPSCGDGFIDPGEDCDSSASNGANGERCSAKCVQEEASFVIEDINNTQVTGARFAIFNQTVTAIDINSDAVLDLDRSILSIAISTEEDLCAQLAANPNFIDTATDVDSISIVIFKNDALGEGGFLSGQTILNVGAPLDLFFASAPGQVFIGATVVVRRAGVTLVNANDNILFEQNDDTLEVVSINNAALEATFSGNLFFDISGQLPFDVDVNIDGTDDSSAIDASLSAAVHNASLCPNL